MLPPINPRGGALAQATSYSFLVQHIPKPNQEKEEPGSGGRQKRRRTRSISNLMRPPSVLLTKNASSPQDHALLEAAYQRNSKPDKNERIEIVSQVALGEKEVQVRWCDSFLSC